MPGTAAAVAGSASGRTACNTPVGGSGTASAAGFGDGILGGTAAAGRDDDGSGCTGPGGGCTAVLGACPPRRRSQIGRAHV